MILDEIVSYKKTVVSTDKEMVPQSKLLAKLDRTPSCFENVRDFKGSITGNKSISIIAEVKKASPSKGIIRREFDHLVIAKQYEKNRVEAISVLTEDKFFMGANFYLKEISAVTDTPLLRKDFIIDEYQIYQAKQLGADVILLIVAILSQEQLVHFQRIARELKLQCLVEVHDFEELTRALEAEAEIIGINNRNLKTFQTRIDTTAKLIEHIPKNKVIISESGIHSREDMIYLEGLGVHGVLVGESLMVASDAGKKIRELRGE